MTLPTAAAPAANPANFPASPPLAVLDNNVVFDWLIFADPGFAPLAAAVEAGELRWIGTQAMLDEARHVIARGALAAWSPDDADFCDSWHRWSHTVETAAPLRQAGLRCGDPDDQKFIDLAVQAGARWLFTKDRALLRLAKRASAFGVSILTPQDWIRREQREAGPITSSAHPAPAASRPAARG